MDTTNHNHNGFKRSVVSFINKILTYLPHYTTMGFPAIIEPSGEVTLLDSDLYLEATNFVVIKGLIFGGYLCRGKIVTNISVKDLKDNDMYEGFILELLATRRK